jgi:hypothetical protein
MPRIYKAVDYTKQQIEELEVDQMQFPYNDEEMQYNGVNHTYVPTEKAFLNRGVNIREILKERNLEDVEDFCKYVSFKFYLYAIRKCRLSGELTIKYLVAKRGVKKNYFNLYEYRNAVVGAMVYLGEYLANNGDLSQVNGVDLTENTSLDITTLRNEERDYPNGFREMMTSLGLNYVGQYRFQIEELGKEW